MDRKLVISGTVALPATALAVVGGYALGYLHGHQDALGSVWNLRNAAQCLDPSVATNRVSTMQEGAGGRSQWVWKSGPHAGEAVRNWPRTLLTNPFTGRRVPRFLNGWAARLERSSEIDIASWRPPSY